MPDRPIAFSIVLPTFNRSRLLSRAIDSVLRQDCRNWELIVVNDGSTDKTREVMRSYADDRITYIEHQTNLGMNAALNTGFQRARGKYVAKLDDDDELANFAIGTALSAWKKLGDSKTKLLFFDSI